MAEESQADEGRIRKDNLHAGSSQCFFNQTSVHDSGSQPASENAARPGIVKNVKGLTLRYVRVNGKELGEIG